MTAYEPAVPFSLSKSRRRRPGLTGMVMAELREVAEELGVSDVYSLRRTELMFAIKDADPTGHTWRVRNIEERALNKAARHLAQGGVVDDQLLEVEETKVEETKVEESEVEEGEVSTVEESPRPPSPPRLLTMSAALLAPGERDNWLGELRTAMWELRGDRRARRRAVRGFRRELLGSLVVSWRHGGGGSSEQEMS